MEDVLRVRLFTAVAEQMLILQTLFTFPAMRGAISSVRLVENSTKMQQVQADKLGLSLKERGIALDWSDKIEDIAPSEL